MIGELMLGVVANFIFEWSKTFKVKLKYDDIKLLSNPSYMNSRIQR
jgi:hypothetical protein